MMTIRELLKVDSDRFLEINFSQQPYKTCWQWGVVENLKSERPMDWKWILNNLERDQNMSPNFLGIKAFETQMERERSVKSRTSE